MSTVPTRKERYVVKADRFDFASSGRAFSKLPKLMNSQKELSKHETGVEAMRDVFHLLVKSSPAVRNYTELMPKFAINCKVINEIVGLEEFESLHKMSVGDSMGAALACISLENKLDVIFDKLKHLQDLANKIQEKYDAREVMMMEQDDDDGSDSHPELEDINEEIESMTQTLQNALEINAPAISSAMQSAIKGAQKTVESGQAAVSWGMAQSELTRMSMGERIELAKRFSTTEFKELAELFGKLESMYNNDTRQAEASQSHDIYDIERGRNWNRLLGSEKALFGDDILFYEQAKKLIEGSLIQHKFKDEEPDYRGQIIFVCDGSASMSWGRSTYAKAIGLALLKVAQKQQRPFSVILFGGVKEFSVMEFTTNTETLTVDVSTSYNNEVTQFSGFDAVMALAEINFAYSGTCFETPFDKAKQLMLASLGEDGKASADIVFATDGQRTVGQDWLDNYHEIKERLEFKVFGFNVGDSSYSSDERGLKGLCDVVMTPENLTDGTDMATVFKALR